MKPDWIYPDPGSISLVIAKGSDLDGIYRIPLEPSPLNSSPELDERLELDAFEKRLLRHLLEQEWFRVVPLPELGEDGELVQVEDAQRVHDQGYRAIIRRLQTKLQ